MVVAPYLLVLAAVAVVAAMDQRFLRLWLAMFQPRVRIPTHWWHKVSVVVAAAEALPLRRPYLVLLD